MRNPPGQVLGTTHHERNPMTDIVQDVADLAKSVGLEVHGMGCGPQFARFPMVYGPLDSIAILVDTLLEKQAETPRRYRKRRVRI